MELTSRELQYLCIVCFIVTSACLSITSSGTFEINTEVNFTCVHDSYTGSHRWKVDTAEVLICASSTCLANLSNPTRYSFVSDPGNGVFVFTINPVSRLDDDSVIGCHNGSDEETFKLEVKDPADSQIITSDGLSTGTIAGIILGAIFGFALVLCCCAYILYILGSPMELSFKENENNDEMPYVSWIPGCCGKWPKTFILRIEKVPENENDTKNTTASGTKHIVIGKESETLDVECYNQFDIDANNVFGDIRMQIKGRQPSSLYEMTLCAKILCCQSKANNLTFWKCGKPYPPKKFKFNENINNDEMPCVSWEPGFNGGCNQTFFLRFEKNLIKTHNQTHKTRGKPMSIKKITFVEGYHEILDVKSNNIFAITSPKEAKEILLQIKGREPSSTYKITLYSENKYGKSKVMTLDGNETTILSHISDHSDQQEQKKKVQLDGIVVEAADGSSLRPLSGHTNQPKHDKTLQRHGHSVEESTGFGLTPALNIYPENDKELRLDRLAMEGTESGSK